MASKNCFADAAGATEDDDEATDRVVTLAAWWLGRERSDLRPMVFLVKCSEVVLLSRTVDLNAVAILQSDR